MKIGAPGNIDIYMYSEPSRDIDFCCWGPFDDPEAPCPNGLILDKVVDCSYAAAHTETCNIPSNAQTGEYYILVITNYSNYPCNISFSKTGGTGTTDCGIMPPLINSNSPLCVGETLYLTAESVSGASYSWSGPDGWTSNQQNPTRSNVTMNMAGTYTCDITVGSQSSDPVTTEVEIYAQPNANFNNTTVCSGTPTQFTCTSTTNPPGHTITSRSWKFGDGSTGSGSSPTHTYAHGGTYNAELTVQAEGGCSDSKTKTVTVYDSPKANAGNDQTIQYGGIATLNGSGGQGNFTYHWEPADKVVNPNAASTQTVALTASQVFTLTVSSLQGNCTDDDQVVISIDGAAMNATATADNNEICDNETTQFHATASGGTGSYSYNWTPTTGLDNPNIANPIFTPEIINNPSDSKTYTCTINDGQTTQTPQITINIYKTYPEIFLEDSVCQGDNDGHYQEYQFDMSTLEPGNFTDTKNFPTKHHGCDSIVTLNLTVYPAYNDDLSTSHILKEEEVCQSDLFYNKNGFSVDLTEIETPEEWWDYTQYDIRKDTVTEHGCDSVIKLHLKVYAGYTEELENEIYDTAVTCDKPITLSDYNHLNEYTLDTTGDYKLVFKTTYLGCDSVVYFHFEKNPNTTESIENVICNGIFESNGNDTIICDDDGKYWYYPYKDWDNWNEESFKLPFPGHYEDQEIGKNDVGCKMTVNYDITLFNELYVSPITGDFIQVYYTGTGFDFYDYEIKTVTGGGTDEPGIGTPPEYKWDISMITIDTTITQGKWSCKNDDNKPKTTVYVNCQGAAYLTCTVTTAQCSEKTVSLLLYTPGQCVDPFYLNVDNIGIDNDNRWVEVSWQCSADSCEVRYGSIEDPTHYQSKIVYTNNIRLTGLDNQNYWWKVKALCDREPPTVFVDGPTIPLSIEDNFIDKIQMYPNPAKNELTITGEDIKIIEIYNTVGQEVYQNNFINNNVIHINTTDINSGMYLVRIRLKDGKAGVKKLVIE